MIPITIDISDVASEFNLSTKAMEGMLSYTIQQLVARTAEEWQTQAKLHLGQTKMEYIRSIVVVDKGRFEGQVKLIGWLPNAIESGLSGFDMKLGFSRSSKKKMKKDGGWYLTIPFRYATAEAIGDAGIFTGKLPEAIQKIAKKLKEGETLQLKDIPKEFQIPKTREALVLKSVTFEAYKNKSSQYEGMKHITTPHHGGYVTFRRVSDESDGNSWIHTGIIARNLAEKALEEVNVPAEVDRNVDIYLSQLGF